MSSRLTDWLADDLVVGVDRPDAGQVEQRVEQHRGVAGGEHEAVAVRPDRVGGVEAQEALPERVGDRRQRHRRPGMAGVRLLDRVDRQRADRVDAELVDLGGRPVRCPCPHPIETRLRASNPGLATNRDDREARRRRGRRGAGRGRHDGRARHRLDRRLPAAGARRARARDPLRRDLGRDRGGGPRARDRGRAVRRARPARHRDRRRRPGRARRLAGQGRRRRPHAREDRRRGGRALRRHRRLAQAGRARSRRRSRSSCSRFGLAATLRELGDARAARRCRRAPTAA